MAQTEFRADIIGTNGMGGVPCPPPHILANALSQGANVSKIVTTWYPGAGGRTIMCVYVDNEIDQMGPQQAFDGSLFQFQKVTRASSPTSIEECVEDIDSKEGIESKQSKIEFDTLKYSVGETGNTIKILKEEYFKLEGKISSRTNKFKKLEKQTESLEERNKVLKEQNKKLEEENKTLKSNNIKLNKSNSERKEQKKTLKSGNLSFEKENKRLIKDIDGKRNQKEKLDQIISKMNKEKKGWASSKKSMDKELEQINSQIEDKLIYFNKLENKNEAISKKITDLNGKLDKLKKEIKKQNQKLGKLLKYIEDRESLGKSLCQAIEMQQNDLKKEAKNNSTKSFTTMDLIKQTAIDNLENCHYLTGFRGRNIVGTVINICQFIKNLTTNFGKDFLIESDVEIIIQSFNILKTSEYLMSFPGDNVLDKMKQIEQFFESYVQKLGNKFLKKENISELEESISFVKFFNILVTQDNFLKKYKKYNSKETIKKITKAFIVTNKLMKEYRQHLYTKNEEVKQMSILVQQKIAQISDLYTFQSLFRRYANKLSGYELLDIMIDEGYGKAKEIVSKNNSVKPKNYWDLIQNHMDKFFDTFSLEDYNNAAFKVTKEEIFLNNKITRSLRDFSNRIGILMDPKRLLRWYQFAVKLMFQDEKVVKVINDAIKLALVRCKDELAKSPQEFTEEMEDKIRYEIGNELKERSLKFGIQQSILDLDTTWLILELTGNSPWPQGQIVGKKSTWVFPAEKSQKIINNLLQDTDLQAMMFLTNSKETEELEDMQKKGKDKLGFYQLKNLKKSN
jgi:hypothetical protein